MAYTLGFREKEKEGSGQGVELGIWGLRRLVDIADRIQRAAGIRNACALGARWPRRYSVILWIDLSSISRSGSLSICAVLLSALSLFQIEACLCWIFSCLLCHSNSLLQIPCIDCKMSMRSNSKCSNKYVFVLLAFPILRPLSVLQGEPLSCPLGAPWWHPELNSHHISTSTAVDLGCWHSPCCQTQLCDNDSVCQHAYAVTQETGWPAKQPLCGSGFEKC